MPFDRLQSPVKIAILRPDAGICVFFRHEAANVKNQMSAPELPGHRAHHCGHVIACMQNIDTFAPHYSEDGPGARSHIVNRRGQRRPLVIGQVMPG